MVDSRLCPTLLAKPLDTVPLTVMTKHFSNPNLYKQTSSKLHHINTQMPLQKKKKSQDNQKLTKPNYKQQFIHLKNAAPQIINKDSI